MSWTWPVLADEDGPDPRATPPMHSVPAEPQVPAGTDFYTVEPDEARPCYICGRNCLSRADFRTYTMALHPYCAHTYGNVKVNVLKLGTVRL